MKQNLVALLWVLNSNTRFYEKLQQFLLRISKNHKFSTKICPTPQN
jgi:hypothetical protein